MNFMRAALAAIIINLWQWQPAQLWDHNYVSNFITPLARMLRSQELIWFLSEIMDSHSSEHLQDFMVHLHTATGLTQTVITNRSDIRIRQTDIRRNSICLVFTTNPVDPIMDVHAKVMLGRHFFFGMIVMVDVISDFELVRAFLQDMRQRNFQNTLFYYHSSNDTNELFMYSMYPEFKVENRSNFISMVKQTFQKFMSGGDDIQGYKYPSPMRLDLPHVFRYNTDGDGTMKVRGISYQMLHIFMNYMNGSLENYDMERDALGGDVIDMKAALDLVRTRQIPILAHAYALFKVDDEIDKSYPIMVVKWCLMVPIWNSFSALQYPVQPFNTRVWYALGGSFVGLVVVECIWYMVTLRPRTTTKLFADISNIWVDTYCLVINVVTPRPLRTPSWIRFVVYAAIFFHGFFVSVNYTSLLGSILAVTIFREQIDTMDDVVRANISVMIIDYEFDFLLSGGYELPDEFLLLLKTVDAATFNLHQLTFNESFAYFVTEDKWHFLDLQQKYLELRKFKFTDICFGSYHLAFPMEPDSTIWRNLEYYLFRMHSSGLLQYLETNTFDSAVHAGLVSQFTEASHYTSAGMQHLQIVFVFTLVMFAVSFVILICERLWKCRAS